MANNGFVVVRHTIEGIKYRGKKTRENAVIVESLGTRSDQIGDIVETIEDIADQTNLLALMLPLRRPVQVNRDEVSRLSPMRCGLWPSGPRAQPEATASNQENDAAFALRVQILHLRDLGNGATHRMILV